MNKKLQVFISSTYTDLIEERQAAVEAILVIFLLVWNCLKREMIHSSKQYTSGLMNLMYI